MIDPVDSLRRIVSDYIELSDVEWEWLLTLVEFRTLAKGEVLVYEGERVSGISVVLDGLLRTYFTRADCEERTFFFSPQGELAGDYEGMSRELPSRYSIDALEPTTIAVLSAEGLQQIMSSHSSAQRVFIAVMEKYFFLWSERISDFYMHTPKERYDKMCRRYPSLIQRVPQYLIASYLNISTVHLSRLRRDF